jgi:hypothetical protein
MNRTLRLTVAAMAFVACAVQAQVPATVDAEQKTAVKELLDVMNFKERMTQMGSMMTMQMPKLLDQMMEGSSDKNQFSADQKIQARKLAQESSTNSARQISEIYNDPQFVQQFEDIMARAYAKHFTTAEIRATTAFYASPVGKKALTIMPQMMQETMPEIIGVMAPRMNAVMEKMAKDVIARVEKKSQAETVTK